MYDERWGDTDGCISVDKIQRDLDVLWDTSKKVAMFATKTVAHIDKRKIEEIPTFIELEEAIEKVGEIFVSYALLLTASHWVRLAPTIQDNWRATFRRPLFE